MLEIKLCAEYPQKVRLPVAVAIIAIATTTKTKLNIVKAFILGSETGEIT